MGEILFVGLQADSTSMMDLRTMAEWVVAVFNSHNNPAFVVYPEKGKPFTPKVPKDSGYEREIKEFVAWISGREANPVTAKSARDSVAIVDAERKSAKIGRPVRPLS